MTELNKLIEFLNDIADICRKDRSRCEITHRCESLNKVECDEQCMTIADFATELVAYLTELKSYRLSSEHGKWMTKKSEGYTPGGNGIIYCSNCGWEYGAHTMHCDYNFCPYCGARMTEKGEETSEKQ